MDTNLKENVIFSDFIISDYDIETQLKKHKSEHVFEIFDYIATEIDRESLLENDFLIFALIKLKKKITS